MVFLGADFVTYKYNIYLPGGKMPKTNNPLAQFFRQPAIYIRLPSGGHGWPAGTLNLPPNGELPVLPMTAIDEITYRTPDALFNGEAVVSVIQSCVPNIRDAWAIPVTDLDSILVAIRIASYGHAMEIDTACPACKEEALFGLDLRTVMDRLKSADYSNPLTVGDLTFYFRPLDYRQVTDNSILQFEQQKTMQMVSDADASQQDKVSQLNRMMRQLVDATVTVLAQSIMEIRSSNAHITEHEHILEYMQNCDRSVFSQIRDYAVALREASELKPLNITCPSCQNKYEQAFTLDTARFFESAS
jgi:hypothetical protein